MTRRTADDDAALLARHERAIEAAHYYYDIYRERPERSLDEIERSLRANARERVAALRKWPSWLEPDGVAAAVARHRRNHSASVARENARRMSR